MYGVPKEKEELVTNLLKSFSRSVKSDEKLPNSMEISAFVRQIVADYAKDEMPDEREFMDIADAYKDLTRRHRAKSSGVSTS